MAVTRSRYTESEVRTLVEGFATLRAARDTDRQGLRALIAVADLTRAMRYLPLAWAEVVVLHGCIGLTNVVVGELLGVSESAVRKRYRYGLEQLLLYLNGGDA